MSAWMLYAVGVALLMCLLALAAERLALAFGVSTRWAWLTALAASVAIPVLAPRLSAGHGMGGSIGTIRVIGSEAPLPPPLEASAAGAPWYDAALLVVWVAASVAILTLFVTSLVVLERRRRSWPRQVVAGAAVLISERTGPALIGFFAPAMVIPRWMTGWDEGRLRLLFAHEREHQNGGDPLLLLAAIGALILMPWNLPLWWQVRRLRLAIEIDCDSRVLRRHHEPQAYGLLLLDVGAHMGRSAITAVAFSEPTSFLERRVKALRGRQVASRGVALALIGVAAAAPIAVYALPVPEPPRLASILGSHAADDHGGDGDGLPGEAAAVLGSEREKPSGGAAAAPEIENAIAAPPERGIDAAATDPASSGSGRREGIAVWTRPPGPAVGASAMRDTIPQVPGDPRSTPYDVKPELENRTDFARALQAAYPEALRDAGIGGTTVLWIFLGSDGAVGDTRIARSSGYHQLDHAAQAVMRTARFTPARNRGEAVAVWIQLPVSFSSAR